MRIFLFWVWFWKIVLEIGKFAFFCIFPFDLSTNMKRDLWWEQMNLKSFANSHATLQNQNEANLNQDLWDLNSYEMRFENRQGGLWRWNIYHGDVMPIKFGNKTGKITASDDKNGFQGSNQHPLNCFYCWDYFILLSFIGPMHCISMMQCFAIYRLSLIKLASAGTPVKRACENKLKIVNPDLAFARTTTSSTSCQQKVFCRKRFMLKVEKSF